MTAPAAPGNAPDNTSEPGGAAASALTALGPGVFVFLWSTGFVGSKLGAPYAEPFSFLGVRFAIAAVLMGLIAWRLGARWPSGPSAFGQIALTGLLVQGFYLGGVFWAIDGGFSVGTSALIVSMSPLLVGVLAGPVLGERITARRWAGLVLGFIGVALVVQEKAAIGPGQAAGAVACVIALAAVSAGTLLHKRIGDTADLSAAQTIQLGASALAMGAFAFVFETRVIVWSGEFIFALTWLILVLSLGGFTLLLALIRRGATSKVMSLLYLTPPLTALIAFALFGESLSRTAVIGMFIAAAGVALVTRAPDSPKDSAP
ncbi:MAG: DMT family transporter [Rhodospirillales bacterium]